MIDHLYSNRLSSVFFDVELFFGVVFDDASLALLIFGKLSAAAARSAKNLSNSVLVKLSSGPLSAAS